MRQPNAWPAINVVAGVIVTLYGTRMLLTPPHYPLGWVLTGGGVLGIIYNGWRLLKARNSN